MGFLHIIITFLSMLSLIVSHAAAGHVSSSSSPETYWKSVLPNTPIPKSVSQLLNNIDTPPGTRAEETSHSAASVGSSVDATVGSSSVGERGAKHTGHEYVQYDSKLALFFLEKDMYQGHTMNNLQLTKTLTIIPSSTFLPREVANTIPFSSNNLPEIYKRFSIKPETIESKSMKKTINLCEEKATKEDEKYCATSLEDMVDFTTSKLGKNVKAISTEVIKTNKGTTPFQTYTIDGSRKVATNKFVSCHRQSYPYAVFYCHKAINTRAYIVSLSGEDGTKAKALAICHKYAAKLYPKDLVFKHLKVKPGTSPICHFLPEGHVVFVPY